MDQRVQYGLVGRGISYSFSKTYFEEKFSSLSLGGHSYAVYDIDDIAEIQLLFSLKALRGLNVTIPYKEKIVDFLDDLSDEAREIGAVNTVKIDKNGRKVGYNTDAFGFEKTLLLHKEDRHRSALILGAGGAAKAVSYILEKHDIPRQIISRRGEVNFKNIAEQEVRSVNIIVQCTPVGTFPNIDDCLDFPFHCLDERHLVIDLIYNPSCTSFMRNASKRGAKVLNGYHMLCQQAEKSWEIWNS